MKIYYKFIMSIFLLMCSLNTHAKKESISTPTPNNEITKLNNDTKSNIYVVERNNQITDSKQLKKEKTDILKEIKKHPNEEINLNLSSLPSDIDELPEWFFKGFEKTNLTYIKINNSNLTKLPESLCNIASICEMDLAFNYLTELPESIGNLINLHTLNLEHNSITILPESFGNLLNLKWLNIKDNFLIDLPTSFINLHKLEDLSLDKNTLTASLISLIDLKKLSWEKLNISGLDNQNPLSTKAAFDLTFHGIPEANPADTDRAIERCAICNRFIYQSDNKTRLTCNHLFHKRCITKKQYAAMLERKETFPCPKCGAQNKVMDNFYSFNINKVEELVNIAKALVRHTNRKPHEKISISLNFSNDRTKNYLKILTHLQIFFNEVKNIYIDELYIHRCNALMLPENLGINLSHLTKLVITENSNLEHLPDSICNLANLESANFSFNNLKDLPSNIGNLKNLEVLFLQYNQLNTLPKSTKDLCKLRKIELEQNHFKTIPTPLKKLSKKREDQLRIYGLE